MIDPQAGRQLLCLARNTLALFLECGEKVILDERALAPALVRQASSFVTLYNYHDNDDVNRLRGCIGSTHAHLPLAQDVMRNTVAAARDPRFHPVIAAELPHLNIQISVLHPPFQLDFVDYDDLLTMLRPGVDGVIIAWHEQRGLLLPQVWDRLPDADSFLQALCHKAQIPWQTFYAAPGEVEVLTFETTSFSEMNFASTQAKDGAAFGSDT